MAHYLTSNSFSESSFESEFMGQTNKTSSLSNFTGLFVGFSPKCSESDSVRSPTSPLDFWVFPNLANPLSRSPKSPHNCWGNSKVGLSIIDSIDDSKNVLVDTSVFHSSVNNFEGAKSLPKNYRVLTRTQFKPSNLQKGSSGVVLGIGKFPSEPEPFGNFVSCSWDSGKSRLTNFSIDSSFENLASENGMSPLSSNSKLLPKSQVLDDSSAMHPNYVPNSVSSAHDFIGSLSASEIELSEDYTCVKTFGPNPKITHIFGDFVLECRKNKLTNVVENEEQKNPLGTPNSYPSDNFLILCYCCKKKLEGKDIYIYRGEKSFCSSDCRLHEILIDEEKEKKESSAYSEKLFNPNCHDGVSKPLMFIG